MPQMWLKGNKGKRTTGKDKGGPCAGFYVLRNLRGQMA